MAECIKDKFIYNSVVYDVSCFDDSILDNEEIIYEVIRVINGKTFQIEYNLNRLLSSIKISNINYTINIESLKNDIDHLIRINNVINGNLKLIIFKAGENVSIIIYFISHYYPTDEQLKYGVEVKSIKIERSNPTAKIINKNLRKLANDVISKCNIFETALIDHENYITEGSRSNIFFIKDGVVYTSPDQFVLNGTARKRTIEICNRFSIKLVKERVLFEKINDFESVFLTGTSLGVLPIYKIDNYIFDVDNNVLKFLQSEYQKLLNANV